jgi:hypothetical protein
MKTLDLNVCGVSGMSLAQMQEVGGGCCGINNSPNSLGPMTFQEIVARDFDIMGNIILVLMD